MKKTCPGSSEHVSCVLTPLLTRAQDLLLGSSASRHPSLLCRPLSGHAFCWAQGLAPSLGDLCRSSQWWAQLGWERCFLRYPACTHAVISATCPFRSSSRGRACSRRSSSSRRRRWSGSCRSSSPVSAAVCVSVCLSVRGGMCRQCPTTWEQLVAGSRPCTQPPGSVCHGGPRQEGRLPRTAAHRSARCLWERLAALCCLKAVCCLLPSTSLCFGTR